MASVASLFISRWDPATAKQLPDDMQNELGLAIGRQTYVAYREFFASERWQRLLAAGARPQRLLFASTGTKDPSLPPTLYITGLAAPDTVNTMPEETLLATGASEDGRHGASTRTRRTSSRASPRPAWTSTPSPASSSARAPSPSWAPGPRCWTGSPPRSQRSARARDRARRGRRRRSS